MDSDEYLERAARNVHDLFPSEIGALRSSAEFRDRVQGKYKELYGDAAEVTFDVRGSYGLNVSWFRPTVLLYQAPPPTIECGSELVVAVDASLIQAVNGGKLDLFGLSSRQFEEFMAELLEELGWYVELTKRTHDNGYDIFACKTDALGLVTPMIVQCKRYRADHKVGVSFVRELHAVQTTMNIPHAVLATTSTFTRPASHFAQESVKWGFLKLADYETLTAWLSKVKSK